MLSVRNLKCHKLLSLSLRLCLFVFLSLSLSFCLSISPCALQCLAAGAAELGICADSDGVCPGREPLLSASGGDKTLRPITSASSLSLSLSLSLCLSLSLSLSFPLSLPLFVQFSPPPHYGIRSIRVWSLWMAMESALQARSFRVLLCLLCLFFICTALPVKKPSE